jgi:hypothetical protein
LEFSGLSPGSSKCKKYAGTCANSAEANTNIYKKVVGCYWTSPYKVYDDSGCGNFADLMPGGADELSSLTYLTCHQKCQEDGLCMGFTISDTGTCSMIDVGACSFLSDNTKTYYTRTGFTELPDTTNTGKCTHMTAVNAMADKVSNCKDQATSANCKLNGMYYTA